MTDIKISIVDCTGFGNMHTPAVFAAAKLVFTKNTRLSMDSEGFQKFLNMAVCHPEEIQKELDYMAGTIPSSWEFVDVTFMVENISRACAQQMTRTRTASFAMQSQRVTDMSGVSWCNPFEDRGELDCADLNDYMQDGINSYESLIEAGVAPQDARGVLPINVHCNLVAKYNLRTIVELVQARENAIRVQGEYVEVVRQMKAAVLEVYPWAKTFFEPKHAKAIAMIEEEIGNAQSGKEVNFMNLAKSIDLVKKG